ncbi:MAG: sigma-54-dependent Fis family transcriptional regulator [Fimbriimonadaceae bacterium]|nr:sigma-54-dependent Fis family transcriptional regulator [Fimbriimonadaceae bacterium]
MNGPLLIVDDEPNIRRILQVAFEKAGIETVVAENGLQALRVLETGPVSGVLTDVTMPEMTGFELHDQIIARWPDLPVIIMTAYGTIPQAVAAIRKGAYEFITKPFDLDSLKKIVKSALGETPAPRAKRGAKKGKATFIAASPAMKEVEKLVQQVADTRATVLITGESGTGKEVVAKLLHELSPRAGQPFIAASCAAIPESLMESELFGYEKGAFTGAQGSKPGRFELANNGSLFLDEIGDVPPLIQVKLLRVLQEREFERLGATAPTKVDVRLITATNRDLHQMVEDGAYRLDLLYRLQVVEVHLAPLRSRVEDVGALASHFLAKFSAENGRSLSTISQDAMRRLEAYAWPGNVRELSNAIERATVLAAKEETVLEVSHLPSALRQAA